MNAFFFGTKRAYYSTLRLMRRPFQSFGLTAARFDLMYVLLQGTENLAMVQSEIGHELGVTPSVVSRMLRSLEALGLVERERSEEDRRHKWVLLTVKGKQLVQDALRTLRRASERAVDMALGRDSYGDKNAVFMWREYFDSCLRGLQEFCNDTGSVFYPWHPDD